MKCGKYNHFASECQQIEQKPRSHRQRHVRQFDVDDSSVEIELSVSTKKVISRAYVDGEIVVHDLFPQFSKYVSEEGAKKRPSIFVTFGLWLALAIVMGFIFQGMR